MFRLKKGMGLLEVLVGLSIIAVAMAAIVGTYRSYLKAALSSTDSIKAAYLAEEGFEAVKFLRDSGWTSNIASLSAGTNYSLWWSGTTWKATTTPQYVDGIFWRYFTISPVSRDANDDITTSGGTDDPNTKRIDVTIAWPSGAATTTKTISTYITNLFSN